MKSKQMGMAGWLAVGLIAAAGLGGGSLSAAESAAQGVAIKSGESIGFLGDSITAQGAGPRGYVSLVVVGLATNGMAVKAYPAGISGHKSNQMLARLEKDVLSKKPTWMTVSCGVNDVWHGKNGVALPQYASNMTAIVSQAQAAGIQVMILTSTMIRETQTNSLNQQLIPYNDFLRTLAKEKKCLLADLGADMQAAVAAGQVAQKGNILTGDGVHMNVQGNRMMARGVLKAFGLSEAQLQLAEKAWDEIPVPAPKATQKAK